MPKHGNSKWLVAAALMAVQQTPPVQWILALARPSEQIEPSQNAGVIEDPVNG
jgi:hypothetical protein